MSKFDFNQAADFQKATFSGGATLLQQLSGNSATHWAVDEASFRNVIFNTLKDNAAYQAAVPTVQDTGGRRKVKYLFPYVDGQTTDDLGRRPQSFSFTVVFFGDKYLAGYKSFKKVIDDPTPGLLKHPIMGQFNCVVEEYSIVHIHNARKSLEMHITFTEHNFNVGALDKQANSISSLKSALTQAIQLFNLVNNARTAITAAPNFFNSIKNTLQSILNSIFSASAIVLANINATYNPNGSNVDIPSIVPSSQGGTLQTTTTTSNGNVIVTVNQASVSSITTPSDPFSAIPLDQISSLGLVALANETIQNQVNNVRELVNSFITTAITQGDAFVPLDLYQTLLDIRSVAILLQQAFEAGVASSNATIIEYITPRLMTIREVAFANNIDPDRSIEIELLNPTLLSFNYIDPGTSLQLPSV